MKVKLGRRSRWTVYNGVRMRSLAEAHVARKLDALGIKWRYEGYVKWTSSGWYCPDFYLPGLRCWIEVKGPEPTDEERQKCSDVALATGKDMFLVWEDGTRCFWYESGTGKEVRIDGF